MKRLTFIIISVCLTVVTEARTIRVGPSLPLKSIKQALALAAPGDSILVQKGTYREGNIVVDKPVVLKGLNTPILDGQKKYEVVTVKASNVSITGFKVIRSGHSSLEDLAGIKIVNARQVTIANNSFDDNFFAVYSQLGVSCLIKNNEIKTVGTTEQLTGNGIHCWKSDSMQIIGNRIQGHRDGIYFEFVTNSIIWRNTSTKNLRYGLHFMFSHNNSYISNFFIKNGAGVAVMFTHGVKMFNNYFEENWGEAAYGLFLKEISDSYISGNHFIKNTAGITMEGTSRIVVEKNQFYQNGWAMQVQASCDGNTITNNNFISNTFDLGTNGTLNLNTFNHNYWSKYEGYDLNKDGIGDIPFRPVSIYSMIVQTNPPAMMLFRSFMVSLLDKTEKLLPSVTPNLIDETPLMSPLHL